MAYNTSLAGYHPPLVHYGSGEETIEHLSCQSGGKQNDGIILMNRQILKCVLRVLEPVGVSHLIGAFTSTYKHCLMCLLQQQQQLQPVDKHTQRIV